MNSIDARRLAELLPTAAPLVIDGGLATELEAKGHDIGTRLWSAELLISQPRAIVDAHLAYLEAGASCIISASYQASREGFAELGVDAESSDALVALAVELALQARDEFLESRPQAGFKPLVAASVGPWGATQHDGSEYTGVYDISLEDLRAFHEQRLGVLDRTGADLLACETIPGKDEALILDELLAACRTPSWVSFSCRDARRVSDGTPIRQLASALETNPKILALGINCTPPQFITGLIGEIRAGAPGKEVVVYPNSGEHYDASNNSWHGTAEPLECAAAAQQWHKAGASLIGGCCRMGPGHIRAMHEQFQQGED